VSVVAYFIGGPLDMTKRILAGGDATYRIRELHIATAVEHLYAACPIEISTIDPRPHFAYLYQGESNGA
jgi:hypothetical protein